MYTESLRRIRVGKYAAIFPISESVIPERDDVEWQ